MPVMDRPTLDRVLLSNPTLLHLDASPGAPRSWIQIARTGSFVSNRYGKFEITKADLSQMLFNFQNITPKAPTELPIDVDHLSMAPSKVGDGIAIGWMKKLQLRGDGDELWAEVSWTPQGAQWIRDGSYRFISPSFVKDHVHKNGEKIGTTLLAAAVTNHPFLEGLAAVTLCNDEVMRALAVPAAPTRPRVVSLSELGQKVALALDPALTPELERARGPLDRTQTLVVLESAGVGADEFLRVATSDGRPLGWFRSLQLRPADAPSKADRPPAPLTEPMPTPQETAMKTMKTMTRPTTTPTPTPMTPTEASARLHALAKTRVTATFSLSDALKAVAADPENRVLVEAWQSATRLEDDTADEAPETTQTLSLSATERACSTFMQLVAEVQATRKVDAKAAIHLASQLRPDLVQSYAAGLGA